MAVFASRQIVLPVVLEPIVVTIIGSGNETKCYATSKGAKQYSAGTQEVNTGDMITFSVFGSVMDRGFVKIDGTQVLKATGSATQTYNWTVPNGISTIEIAMEYSPNPKYGKITVTTA